MKNGRLNLLEPSGSVHLCYRDCFTCCCSYTTSPHRLKQCFTERRRRA